MLSFFFKKGKEEKRKGKGWDGMGEMGWDGVGWDGVF